jgi:hypothetical protein
VKGPLRHVVSVIHRMSARQGHLTRSILLTDPFC